MDTLLSPRRRTVIGALGAFMLASCGKNRSAQTINGEYQWSGQTMGSRYNIAVVDSRGDFASLSNLQEGVHASLSRVDRAMSLYSPDSELCTLNRHLADTRFHVSEDVFRTLAIAREVSTMSRGAFDVTVAPLTEVWGFGPSKVPQAVEPREIARLRALVNYQALHLDPVNRSVTKAHPSVHSDLGGIAAGYGVDAAARFLEAEGAENYMIEVSGEVRVRGRNGTGEPWQIGIEQPDSEPRRARMVVPLRDQAMGTSGDYRQYFIRDGRRYPHEIDPHTGYPVQQRLCSVTVVHTEAVYADALSTALIVLGLDRGRALAERLSLAAAFIVREPDGTFRDEWSSAFAQSGATFV